MGMSLRRTRPDSEFDKVVSVVERVPRPPANGLGSLRDLSSSRSSAYRSSVPPTRLLSPEDACRHLKESARAVQWEAFTPRTRCMAEVFFDEGARGCTSPVRRHRTHPGPARQMCEKGCHVPNGVAERDRVEIDEDDLLAGHEDMIRLQVSMDRRRGRLFQASRNLGHNRLDGIPR